MSYSIFASFKLFGYEIIQFCMLVNMRLTVGAVVEFQLGKLE